MGMLDRYKKKGGYFQLLTLVESSPKQKQEHFLELIAAESPLWEKAIRMRMLSFDSIMLWEASFLMEVLTRIPVLTIAGALFDFSEAERESILSVIPSLTKRKILDKMSEMNPTPAEKSSCRLKVVTEVRQMYHQGLIKIDKLNSDFAIPDGIEEMLSSKNPTALQTPAKKGAPATPASNSASHNASSEPQDISDQTRTSINVWVHNGVKGGPEQSNHSQNHPTPAQTQNHGASGIHAVPPTPPTPSAHQGHADHSHPDQSGDIAILKNMVTQMKTKLNRLEIEVTQLTQENQDLKARLAQIKKIA